MLRVLFLSADHLTGNTGGTDRVAFETSIEVLHGSIRWWHYEREFQSEPFCRAWPLGRVSAADFGPDGGADFRVESLWGESLLTGLVALSSRQGLHLNLKTVSDCFKSGSAYHLFQLKLEVA
jgi:hypothetical protein